MRAISVGVVRPLATAESQREGDRFGDVFGLRGRELRASVMRGRIAAGDGTKQEQPGAGRSPLALDATGVARYM